MTPTILATATGVVILTGLAWFATIALIVAWFWAASPRRQQPPRDAVDPLRAAEAITHFSHSSEVEHG